MPPEHEIHWLASLPYPIKTDGSNTCSELPALCRAPHYPMATHVRTEHASMPHTPLWGQRGDQGTFLQPALALLCPKALPPPGSSEYGNLEASQEASAPQGTQPMHNLLKPNQLLSKEYTIVLCGIQGFPAWAFHHLWALFSVSFNQYAEGKPICPGTVFLDSAH